MVVGKMLSCEIVVKMLNITTLFDGKFRLNKAPSTNNCNVLMVPQSISRETDLHLRRKKYLHYNVDDHVSEQDSS